MEERNGSADGKFGDVGKTRIAIYARFSSDLQRPASIEDQVRNCRELAAKKDWVVQEPYIRKDEAKTGRTIVGRAGLQELIRLAGTHPRPFDGILIDDSSRFGRYLPDVLRECDKLAAMAVFVYFATQGMDSREPSFRMLHVFQGMADEQYIKGLGEKVHRGQAGRFAAGFNPGGTCYGYRNVPIEDPLRTAAWGRPVVIGVREEIYPDERKVVVRLFELYAVGTTSYEIARALNDEGLPAPGHKRYWSSGRVRRVLANERYRGKRAWNTAKTEFNPATGKTRRVPNPQHEWLTRESAELRIVPEDLWQRVAKERSRRRQLAPQRCGGMNRTERSRTYLFSGLLGCGTCNGNIVIIGNWGGKPAYGCYTAWRCGTCDNKATITARALEAQLISALVQNLDDPARREFLQSEFVKAAGQETERRSKMSSEAKAKEGQYLRQQANLEKKAERLAAGIAEHGLSPALSEALRNVESRLDEIRQALAAASEEPPPAAIPAENLLGFLERQRDRFAEMLTGDRVRARQELQRRITRLILTPDWSEEGYRIHQVSGAVGIFSSPAAPIMHEQSFKGMREHCWLLEIRLDSLAIRDTPMEHIA